MYFNIILNKYLKLIYPVRTKDCSILQKAARSFLKCEEHDENTKCKLRIAIGAISAPIHYYIFICLRQLLCSLHQQHYHLIELVVLQSLQHLDQHLVRLELQLVDIPLKKYHRRTAVTHQLLS